MNHFGLYFDEDAMDSRLVAALRSRGVRVLTVLDTGFVGRTDEEQSGAGYRTRMRALYI